MENNGNNDNIELSLPINAAYVSAARQTAFTIAGRLGFDAEEAEDVKTAVSEACAYIIKKLVNSRVSEFKILFIPQDGSIDIKFSCAAEGISRKLDNDYSLTLIKGLMDTFDIIDEEVVFEINMTKWHKDSFLDTRDL